MMATYGDMQGRIGDEIQDASLTTQVQRAIQDAIAIYEPTRFYFNQTTNIFWTIRGQEYYGASDFPDIPRLIEIDSLIVNMTGVKIPLKADDYVYMDSAQSGAVLGMPQVYSYYGQQLRLYPIPDTAYQLTMSYHCRLPALVAPTDTNAWMTDGEMLIRQTAKSYLALDVLQETGLVQGAQMMADMALRRLQMETRKRRSNALLKTDLPVTIYAGDTLTSVGSSGIGGTTGLRSRDLIIPAGSAALTASDAYVLIHNSGPAFSLVPPTTPGMNQTIWIKDADGTANIAPIGLAGTVDGVANPVLIDVAYGDVTLLFQGGVIRLKTT